MTGVSRPDEGLRCDSTIRVSMTISAQDRQAISGDLVGRTRVEDGQLRKTLEKRFDLGQLAGRADAACAPIGSRSRGRPAVSTSSSVAAARSRASASASGLRISRLMTFAERKPGPSVISRGRYRRRLRDEAKHLKALRDHAVVPS